MTRTTLQSLLLLALLLAATAAAAASGDGRLRTRHRTPVHIPVHAAAHAPSVIERCQELYYEQPIDHFAYHRERSLEGRTFQQRYFVCAKDWWAGPGAPIFFYCGNEADVTLYLNATGLMWENAEAFGALIVFAEHRYYGKSQPFEPFTARRMDYLSSEQALADYSELVTTLKAQLDADVSPVIAFGGSYGGMLAAWWRVAYPHIVTGAIAGSAPVLDFEGDIEPAAVGSFAAIVTRDATAAGGSSDFCADNVRAAWPIVWDMARTRRGRQGLAEAFRLCGDEPFETEEDVWSLANWIQNAFSYMAMGDYPYPSQYILNGQGTLPAWPVRVACQSLDFPSTEVSNATLLEGLRGAVGVYYNYSRALPCYELDAGVNEESQVVEDHWSYQFCTEMFMPSSSDGVHDMWWPAPWVTEEQQAQCFERFGVRPRPTWISTYYGGRRALASASNIVFSNGLLDPWSGTGVLDDINESVVALLIEEGGHHLDLMWSTPDDPAEVQAVRQMELGYIKRWIEEAVVEEQKQQQQQRAEGAVMAREA